MSEVHLSQVKLLHTVQYEGKSIDLKFADAALYLTSAALGYEDLTLKKDSLQDKKEPIFEAVKKVQNYVLRFFIALAAIITFPVALIGLVIKSCLANRQTQEIQKIKDKALSTTTAASKTETQKSEEKKVGTKPVSVSKAPHEEALDKVKDALGKKIEEVQKIRANEEKARALLDKAVNPPLGASMTKFRDEYVPQLTQMLDKEFENPDIKTALTMAIEALKESAKIEQDILSKNTGSDSKVETMEPSVEGKWPGKDVIEALIAQHKAQIKSDESRPENKKKFTIMKDHKPGDGFVGIKDLIAANQTQAGKFREWAKDGKWGMFSHTKSHYDWWAFPICRDSQHGFKYSVSLQDIEEMKKKPEFMENFKTCVRLVVKSWGWDLDKNAPIDPRGEGQQWDDWDVRLAKMATSLRLFGEWDLFARVQLFVKQQLIQTEQVHLAGYVKEQLLIS